MPSTRPAVPELDAILGEPHPVLDHGFVRVIDYLGNDAAIVQAARVSYGEGTKTLREDEGLIRYLVRNKHTSPLEMAEIKFHCKMPIFIARQWVRHRTASINEYSGRYSVMSSDFYVPEQFKSQDAKNRQGSGDALDKSVNQLLQDWTIKNSMECYALYERMLAEGASRELARMILPVNFYTEWYWKIDLHNLLHFLTLRGDAHAQYEIRAYADVIAEIVRRWV